MNQSSSKWIVPVAVLLAILSYPVRSARAQTPADNTKVNTRDRAKDAATADQQKENVTDRDLTQKIRRALMQDMTLKGPVRSEDERKAVEAKAVDVAGALHVTNQLSVAPSHTKSSKP
jgi:hyperosmotically inducible periplasmic protein